MRLLANQMRRNEVISFGVGAAPDAATEAAVRRLELVDHNGQTPLQLATEHGHPDCAAVLMDFLGTGEWQGRAVKVLRVEMTGESLLD